MYNDTARKVMALIALLPLILNVFRFGDGFAIVCEPRNALVGIGYDYTYKPPKVYKQSDCSKLCHCNGDNGGGRQLKCYSVMKDGFFDRRADLEEICAQEDQANCVCQDWD